MNPTFDEHLNYIRACYPQVNIHEARWHNTDGQFNEVLIINNALAFRFPRSTQVADTFAASIKLMDFLQPRLPIPIPKPEFQNLDLARGRVFVGYRLLPGVLLTPNTLAGIQEADTVDRLADQLARFLQTLHHTRTDDLGLTLPVQDGHDEWVRLYDEFRTQLFPHMRPDACGSVSKTFEHFLNDPQQFDFVPALRHGDFGPSNILYNAATQSIGGVIDFDSIGLGDPATDAAAILNLGEDFFARMCRTYPELAGIRTRTDFYRSTYALQEALYGLRDNVPESFEAGIADYR